MTREELLKKKVTELREIAEGYEDVVGAAGMTKEQLIELVAEKQGIDLHDHVPEGIGRHDIKAKIKKLKALRDQALADGNREAYVKARRGLKHQRRTLRKLIAVALRAQRRTETKAAS